MDDHPAILTGDAAQVAPVDPMMALIERVVLTPDIPLERLEMVIGMRAERDAAAAEKDFAAAFAKMQAALPVIPKLGAIKNRDGKVQSTYPRWEDVNAAVRQPLADNSFSMSFDRRKENDKIWIGCIVTHARGHSRRVEIDLPRDDSGSKNAVQGEGSTVSYGQRYSSKLLLNWVSEGTEDDNGARAGTVGAVSAEQYVELRDKIEESGIAEAVVLDAHKCQSLEQFPAAAFGEAMRKLANDIARKAAK